MYTPYIQYLIACILACWDDVVLVTRFTVMLEVELQSYYTSMFYKLLAPNKYEPYPRGKGKFDYDTYYISEIKE